MRMSALVGRRFKERPAEAVLESHSFLLRGGYARQVANGIYSLLPPGLRVVRKIERIIREEMDRVGGQEVLMPVALPRELWEESGRYGGVGPELLRFKDRTGHDMLLAMTHEEAVVDLSRHEATSYRQYPFMLYQIQTKFRDEPRSRGGLIRVREFTMKDAYSFHRTPEDLERYYRACAGAYRRIFARAGIPEVVMVQSDTGMMGGRIAHEFMLLTDAGEDTIVTCDRCRYLANLDVATGRIAVFPEPVKELEKVHTPGMKTIEEVAKFLGIQPRQTAKVVFYERDAEGRPVMAIIRGDLEINESKLAKVIRTAPALAGDGTIRATGAAPGFASPLGVRHCRIVLDASVRDSNNLVCGANEADYHLRNFNAARDAAGAEIVDIAQVRADDGCPQCEGKIVLRRGIEVGNIFQLGAKYTEAMGMRYLDEEGKEQVPIMGCYGIGVGRLLSSVMEARRDKFGPIWPLSIAPWQVHLVAVDLAKAPVRQMAERLYADLEQAGVEVLFDDRDERAGVQFADGDLLGMPLRLIVSERNLARGVIEWRHRGSKESREIDPAAVVAQVQQWQGAVEKELSAGIDSASAAF